jgi:hypothetical protein
MNVGGVYVGREQAVKAAESILECGMGMRDDDTKDRLRHHFAGLAMQVLLSENTEASFDAVAYDAYQMAGAMLYASEGEDGI